MQQLIHESTHLPQLTNAHNTPSLRKSNGAGAKGEEDGVELSLDYVLFLILDEGIKRIETIIFKVFAREAETI